MKRILILMHEHQRHRCRSYLIDALREVWEGRGLRVSYVYGLCDCPEADLLIPQVDLTRTPPAYVDYIHDFTAVANRDVVDISKRSFSMNLLDRGDDYSGPVIVKTDDNFGGRPEERSFRLQHAFLAWIRREGLPLAERALRQHLAWRSTLNEYPIYNRLAEVPPGAFRNRRLVVERFLPEREGDRYFIRHYLFLGDHSRSVRVAGADPYLKRAACELVCEGLAVPDSVLSLRRRLGLDYGKIDYTVHEGEVVILDVNRTPGPPGTPESTARTVGDLAEGIWSLLRNT